MPHTKILELLKSNYDFRENHILILEALLNEDLTADEISKKTSIPKGRIYEFINYLKNMEMIHSKGKHPKIYSFQPAEDKVREYLEFKFKKTVDDEQSIKGMIKSEKRIVPINNSDDLVPYIRKLLLGRKKFHIVSNMHPHLFYTNDDAIFKRFSHYLIDIEFSMSANPILNLIIKNAYWDAYYNCGEFTYIIDKEVIQDYNTCLENIFSEDERKYILDHIKKFLEKDTVKVYISKVKNPFYMVITEKEVLLITIGKRSSEGAMIENEDISYIYQKMFAEQLSKSKNILDDWDEYF